PLMVSDIFRLPLRTVVASSSAIRSSRSAQQLPPRSAALAEPAPTTSPRAAAMAKRLLAFISAPFICVSKVLFASTEAARVGVLPRIRTATRAHSCAAVEDRTRHTQTQLVTWFSDPHPWLSCVGRTPWHSLASG